MRMPEIAAAGRKAQPQTTLEPRSRPHLDMFIEKSECQKEKQDGVVSENTPGYFLDAGVGSEMEEEEDGEPMSKGTEEACDDWLPQNTESMLRYREPCADAEESDEEDSSAESQDDEVVCKGPERHRNALHLQQRVHSSPYSSQQGVYTHSNHFCGGRLYLSQSNHSSQFNNFNNSQTERKNDSDEEFIKNYLSSMTAEERERVDSNFEELIKSEEMKDLLSNLNITSKEIPSDRMCQWKSPARDVPPPPCPSSSEASVRSHTTGQFLQTPVSRVPPNKLTTTPPPSVLDDDSDYYSEYSESPLSSIHSPRPLSTCSADPPSPFPDPSAGPISSAHPLHRNIRPIHVRPIAPDSTIVHEQQMSVTAESRIVKRLNNSQLGIEWIRVLKDDEFFFMPPNKDDTKLLKHLKSPNQGQFFYEILHCFLERIKKDSDKKQSLEYIKFQNRSGESALRISLLKLAESSLVTRYIVETLSFLGDDIYQMQLNGVPLIHFLVEQGDKAAEVVAELLNIKKEGSTPLFDVNKKNSVLETPLHIAAKIHIPGRLSTLALVKLLINHNASILMEDSNGMTPVHLAVKFSCDRMLIKALLSNAMCLGSVSNAKDYMGNTAMHIAASRNDLPVRDHAQVVKQLKDSNWSLRAKNDFDKTPISLLADDRKQEVLDYINRK